MAAPVDQSGSRRDALGNALLLGLLLLALPLMLASAAKTFNDGDVSWHIAAGQWILHHHRLPTTDPFSFTGFGHPWVAMEWLAELIYAPAYAIAGYAGLAVVVAAALMALNWILYLHLRHFVGALGLAGAIIGANVVLGAFVFARPHVLVWPLLAAWTVMLLKSLETGRPPPLWTALILVAWTNMHGSFPLAIPIAAGIGFDTLSKTGWREWRAWLVFMLVSFVALCLNANGIAGLLQPFHVSSLAILPFVQEWQASTPDFTPQFYVVLLLGIGLMLWAGVKVPLGRLVLLLVMLAMAFSQVRHQSWFIIVAAAVIPPLFATGARRAIAVPAVWPLAVAAVPLLVLRAFWPLVPPENSSNPWRLIAAVPADLRSQPVFNGYSMGGPLILSGIRPYIDGRAEVYGDAFVTEYVAIVHGEDLSGFNRAVRRYGIRWTILPWSRAQLIRELDSSPDWRRLYSDKVGVIHVRRRRPSTPSAGHPGTGAVSRPGAAPGRRRA